MFCLITKDPAAPVLDLTADFFFCGSTAKHFHNLSVSSAAADTTVLPSGDNAICKTRPVCPERIQDAVITAPVRSTTGGYVLSLFDRPRRGDTP